MFLILLAVVLVGAAVHAARGADRSRQRVAELVLVWVLAGYCGVPMVAVSLGLLAWPEGTAAHLGLPPAGTVQMFMGVAYLGMALVGALSVRYRGAYLVAAGGVWAVFFGGATVVHLADQGRRGALDVHDAVVIFATHGLIAAVLAGALVASGLLWGQASRSAGGSAAHEEHPRTP